MMLNFARRSALLLFVAAVAATAGPPVADEPRPSRMQDSRETLAIAYPQGDEVTVKLRGTHRLPGGKGHAEIERKKGATQIKIKLDKMKAAAEFGGDYNTFVLWTLSPEGQVVNAGEFVLDDDESQLEVSTPMRTFALVVTAEPHFAVKVPGRFVVLENTQPEDEVEEIRIVALNFDGVPTRYAYDRETSCGRRAPLLLSLCARAPRDLRWRNWNARVKIWKTPAPPPTLTVTKTKSGASPTMPFASPRKRNIWPSAAPSRPRWRRNAKPAQAK